MASKKLLYLQSLIHCYLASEYAQQGTDCHELCAYLVEKALGRDVIDPTENLTYYDAEMQNCAEEYRNYILEQIEAIKEFCKDPQVMIEQRLDFSRWVENGFGTGDCVIVADEILQIIDYKHGLGILVSAGDNEHGGNSQMMCYALGALEVFGDIYDINQIKMTIFQPRRDNISTYTISKENLLKWADEVLAPTAQLAYVGKGEFNAGDHCTFCKVSSRVMARPFLLSPYSKHLSAMVIWRDLMIRLTQTHTSLTPTALQHLAS